MTTITLSTSEFTSTLGLAARFAAPENYGTPLLASVLLCELDGTLHMVASDRYRVVVARTGAEAPKGFKRLLPVADARRIRRIFVSSRRHDPDLELTYEDVPEQGGGNLVIDAKGGDFDVTLVVRDTAALTAKFPDLLKLFKLPAEPAADIAGFDPRYLEPFRHLAAPTEPLRFSRRGSVLLVEGTRAVGMLMGLRVSDAMKAPDWSHIVKTERKAPAKKAAARKAAS